MPSFGTLACLGVHVCVDNSPPIGQPLGLQAMLVRIVTDSCRMGLVADVDAEGEWDMEVSSSP